MKNPLRRRPAPPPARELTANDYFTIRRALELAVRTYTAEGSEPAAEAARITLEKVRAR